MWASKSSGSRKWWLIENRDTWRVLERKTWRVPERIISEHTWRVTRIISEHIVRLKALNNAEWLKALNNAERLKALNNVKSHGWKPSITLHHLNDTSYVVLCSILHYVTLYLHTIMLNIGVHCTWVERLLPVTVLGGMRIRQSSRLMRISFPSPGLVYSCCYV